MISVEALYASILVIAVLHMIAPDHWIPVTVISESRKYSPGKKYGTSAWIGLSHAAASILLALAVVIAGSVLYSGFSLISGYIGAALLFAAAAYFFLDSACFRPLDARYTTTMRDATVATAKVSTIPASWR